MRTGFIVAYSRTADTVKKAEEKGAIGAKSLQNVSAKLKKPKIIRLMAPAGSFEDDRYLERYNA
jgi:6-phosphogluconate dehydrogenase (decarboxylating)